MNLTELVNQLLIDTKGSEAAAQIWPTADSSIGAFLPEITLCATMVLMLVVRLFKTTRWIPTSALALIGALVALSLAEPQRLLGAGDAIPRMEIFTGMLVYDPFTVFMRSLLLVFLALFVVLTWLTGIPDKEDGPDIYTLVLGATLGMCLMASANHLLMVFMAIEMASVPSYALAGMLKGRRPASEAALKYSVYGAGAAGVMLYGISLVAGLLNTSHLPTLAMRLGEQLPTMEPGSLMVLALGGLMITVGLAFKLSAVPFHFWCPDVFEGASAEVNAFLSVASKAAALALLVRVAIGFGAIPPEGIQPGDITAGKSTDNSIVAEAGDLAPSAPPIIREQTTVAGSKPQATFIAQHDEETAAAAEQHDEPATTAHSSNAATAHSGLSTATLTSNLQISRDFIGKLLAFLAVLTCTFGNLAAYGQTNIKRLFAYSTIAHAGYMMMAAPAIMSLAGRDPEGAQNAVAGLGIYLAVYLFMNLGAFAVIAFLRNEMRSEEIADYAGIVRRCPLTVVCFSLMLFSLIGLPPLAGFIGKFAIFASLVDGYQVSAAAGSPDTYLMWVLLAGGINTAISLIYYMRIVTVMTMAPDPEDRRPFAFPDVSLRGAYLWLLTLPTVVLIVVWSPLAEMARNAAQQLLM